MSKELVEKYKPFSMTPVIRMMSMHDCVNTVIDEDISGDIVECGVWKGGNLMLAGDILKSRNASRALLGYDTFEGMTKPGEHDVHMNGQKATDKYFKGWHKILMSDVNENLSTVCDNFVLIKGDVLKTIPESISEQISILRLDTDWYESTLHELRHLYPLLSPGGFLIIDDYNCWTGSKKAVEDYFNGNYEYEEIDNQSILIRKPK